MKNLITKRRVGIFVGLFALFFVMIVVGSFSQVRGSLSDGLFSEGDALDNIVIVKIDDKSIQEIGRWPWDRDGYVDFLDKLDGAKVIGFDLSFFEAGEGDDLLREEIEGDDRIVLAAEVNEGVLYEPIFDASFGYVNVVTDGDGVTRSVDSRLREGEMPFAFVVYEKGFGKFDVEKGRLMINFVGGPGSFDNISFVDVLNGEGDFEDKIVLIGATAPDLHDIHFVPTSAGNGMSGVEVHANILQNLILDDFVVKQGIWSVILIVFVFGFLGMFYLSRLGIYYSVGLVLLLFILYGLAAVMIFEKFDYMIDVFFVPLSLIIFSGVGQGVNYLEEKKERGYLEGAFGKYISKDLLKEIVEHKQELKLGGGKREITIFFSDIRGFTTISEKLSAEKLVDLLNEYLTAMTEIVLKHKGTVDKFIGDAVMAFWNAPILEKGHEKMACACALEQIQELGRLQKDWARRGYPKIDIGVGLHTGEAVIGNMGSDNRFDYTAMGDTINLGSRLEGLTKQYGVDIIISEETYSRVRGDFKCRRLDKVKVKGKKLPVEIYELCVDYDEEFVREFEGALELYFKKDFRGALKGFKQALGMMGRHVSCGLFIDRCGAFLKGGVGNDWDGSWEMKSK